MKFAKAMRNVERSLKGPLAALCAYEAVALTAPKNRYTPPICHVISRHKWLFPLFCGALGVHIWWLEVS